MARSRSGTAWTVGGLALCAAVVLSYLAYDRSTPYTHGGTGPGLLYGIAALVLMLILLAYGIRKRAYRSRMGTVEGWLRAHLWLGVVALLVTIAHTGFRFQDRIAVALFLVVIAVMASGIVGAILYRTVPRALTEIESNLSAEQMSKELNQLTRTMARIATGKSEPFQRIYAGLVREALPGPLAGWRLLLAGPRPSASREGSGGWAALLGLVGPAEHEELRQLLVTSRQHKELHLRLVRQQRYRNLLEFWLWIHLPLSLAMVVLIAAHLVAVFYFADVLP